MAQIQVAPSMSFTTQENGEGTRPPTDWHMAAGNGCASPDHAYVTSAGGTAPGRVRDLDRDVVVVVGLLDPDDLVVGEVQDICRHILKALRCEPDRFHVAGLPATPEAGHATPFLISAYMASGAKSISPGHVTAPYSTCA